MPIRNWICPRCEAVIDERVDRGSLVDGKFLCAGCYAVTEQYARMEPE